MRAELPVIIPDTHGHLKETERLVSTLQSNGYLDDAPLVLLGDYVDRGPNVRDLIDYAIDLQAQGHTLLKGNHEYVLDKVLTAEDVTSSWIRRWIRNYEEDTLRSYGISCNRKRSLDETRQLLVDAMPDAHKQFVHSLPWMWESKSVVAVHAGLAPGTRWKEQQKLLQDRVDNSQRGPGQLFSHAYAREKQHRLNRTLVTGHASRYTAYVGERRVMLDCGVDQGGPLVAWIGQTNKVISAK